MPWRRRGRKPSTATPRSVTAACSHMCLSCLWDALSTGAWYRLWVLLCSGGFTAIPVLVATQVRFPYTPGQTVIGIIFASFY